jgi:RNA polymerase sigma-70 factor (ECF subfamily)
LAEAVLNRIASGDRDAVQDCLDRYGGLVWSIARKLLRNTDEAEDAVQEVFIDIWKNAGRFDPARSSETTFIAMIARRRIIDRIRRSARRISAEPIEEMIAEPEIAGGRTIQISVEAKQAAEALRELKPDQRRVLQLSIVHGLSHQEIADATGMPLGTVKTHARRGILQARKVLGLGEFDEAREVPA